MVQTFGLFKNGIGIHYAESAVVQNASQTVAKNCTVGKRFPPEIVLVARDDKVTQIHDILPSDSRFKVLVFPGDIYESGRREILQSVADKFVEGKLGTTRSYVGRDSIETTRMVNTFTILKGRKGEVRYWDVPDSLYRHWTDVFLDDVDITGEQGGKAYQNFGISDEGALVVVRPDGYVGLVTQLSDAESVLGYFRGWEIPMGTKTV